MHLAQSNEELATVKNQRIESNRRKRTPTILTIEDMHALAASHQGKCLSTHYVHSISPLTWECAKGHTWHATAAMVKYRGRWCGACKQEARRQSPRIAAKQKAIVLGGKCLSPDARLLITPLTWQCAENHVFERTVTEVLENEWCVICAKRARVDKALKDLQNHAESLGGRLLSTEYVSVHQPMHWQCAEGHTWTVRASRIKNGSWCAKCAKHSRSQNKSYE